MLIIRVSIALQESKEYIGECGVCGGLEVTVSTSARPEGICAAPGVCGMSGGSLSAMWEHWGSMS